MNTPNEDGASVDWPVYNKSYKDGASVDWPVYNKPYVSLEYMEIISETEKAWLVSFYNEKTPATMAFWLPKSQCVIDKETFRIKIPEWIFIEDNIAEYCDDYFFI